MKKQFNKKKLLMFGLPIFVLVLVSAALITHFAVIKQEVNVEQSIKVNGFDGDTPIVNVYDNVYNGWEQKYTSKANVLTNDADRDLNVVISTDERVGITTTYDTVG